MLTILHCKNCNGSTTPTGKSTAMITLESSSYCNECKHQHNATKQFFFCCMKCLIEYISKNPEMMEIETDFFENPVSPMLSSAEAMERIPAEKRECISGHIKALRYMTAIRELREATGLSISHARDIINKLREHPIIWRE